MKRLITNEAYNELPFPIEDITNTSIVGIEWPNRTRSMVIAIEDGIFVSTRTENCTNKWSRKSKKEYTISALVKGAKAFIFSTESELLLWLSGKDYIDENKHIILSNNDLVTDSKSKPADHILLSDFRSDRVTRDELLQANIVTYIDYTTSQFKIIKTRYQQII